MKKNYFEQKIIRPHNLGDLARELDKRLNPDGKRKQGFVFITFPFGSAAISNYISNAARPDMILFLEETLERFKTGQIRPRKTEFNDQQTHALITFIQQLPPEDRKKLIENAMLVPPLT